MDRMPSASRRLFDPRADYGEPHAAAIQLQTRSFKVKLTRSSCGMKQDNTVPSFKVAHILWQTERHSLISDHGRNRDTFWWPQINMICPGNAQEPFGRGDHIKHILQTACTNGRDSKARVARDISGGLPNSINRLALEALNPLAAVSDSISAANEQRINRCRVRTSPCQLANFEQRVADHGQPQRFTAANCRIKAGLRPYSEDGSGHCRAKP